jgi:hypothetical protein
VATFNQFKKAYAAPALKAAGFVREGADYRLYAANGLSGSVILQRHDRDDGDGFWFRYELRSEIRLIYSKEFGLGSTGGLILLQVQRPDAAMLSGLDLADVYWWQRSSGGVPSECLGEHLTQSLTEDVIPNIRTWLDPEELATVILEKRPFHFPLESSRDRLAAFALAAAGPSEKLRAVLERLPDDDDLKLWLDRRFDGREG